eukprot:6178627-Pleurochrysis_carterae.AAC.6
MGGFVYHRLFVVYVNGYHELGDPSGPTGYPAESSAANMSPRPAARSIHRIVKHAQAAAAAAAAGPRAGAAPSLALA